MSNPLQTRDSPTTPMSLSILKTVVCLALFAGTAAAGPPGSFPSSGPTTPGNQAQLRNGLALAPANAPISVKRAIWAPPITHQRIGTAAAQNVSR